MLKDALQDILHDKTAGASVLYRRTLDIFKAESNNSDRTELDDALGCLRSAFPEMAVFLYLQSRLADVSPDNLAARLDELIQDANDELIAIGKALDEIWTEKRRIVLFSYSSVALSLAVARRDRLSGVLVSQASPQNEGVGVAEKLITHNIPVELTTDAALPGLLDGNDLILVGADAVTDEYFVNKTGTYPLFLAAMAAGATRCVVFERFKMVPADHYRFNPRSHSGSELSRVIHPMLNVHNHYFERIPNMLADWLITGTGKRLGKK